MCYFNCCYILVPLDFLLFIFLKCAMINITVYSNTLEGTTITFFLVVLLINILASISECFPLCFYLQNNAVHLYIYFILSFKFCSRYNLIIYILI